MKKNIFFYIFFMFLFSGCTKIWIDLGHENCYSKDIKICEGNGVLVNIESYKIIKKAKKEEIKTLKSEIMYIPEKMLAKNNKIEIKKLKPRNLKEVDITQFKQVEINLTKPYQIKKGIVCTVPVIRKFDYKINNKTKEFRLIDGERQPSWKKFLFFVYIPTVAIDLSWGIPVVLYYLAFPDQSKIVKIKNMQEYERDAVVFSDPLDLNGYLQEIKKEEKNIEITAMLESQKKGLSEKEIMCSQKLAVENFHKKLKNIDEFEKVKNMMKSGDTFHLMTRPSNPDGFGAFSGYALIRNELVIYSFYVWIS